MKKAFENAIEKQEEETQVSARVKKLLARKTNRQRKTRNKLPSSIR